MIFISANKLLEEMQINLDLQCDYDDIKHIIDDLEPKLYVNDDYLEKHIANFTTRPQGEWLPNYTSQFFNPGKHCSLCGKIVEFSENFCPSCGAIMKRGTK